MIVVWNLNFKVWFYNCSLRSQCDHSFPDINECLVNNPCLNDAICENTPGSYICRCKPGFEGNLCQYSEYMNSLYTDTCTMCFSRSHNYMLKYNMTTYTVHVLVHSNNSVKSVQYKIYIEG